MLYNPSCFIVAEMLAIDKQLANEIDFDLRKFDEEQMRKQSRVTEDHGVRHLILNSYVFITLKPKRHSETCLKKNVFLWHL
jgi:hypothetical protein